jgi:tartrate-resistant acid phosphatase type 5
MLIIILLFVAQITDANFVVIGDWGRNSIGQQRLSAAIEARNPNFVISTGDNFYPDGIQHAKDPKIKKIWSDVFNTNRPWISVLGNHDYAGNVSAQLAIPHKHWLMPNRYFDADIGDTAFWFIDTTPWMPFNYVEAHHARVEPLSLQIRQDFEQQQQHVPEQIKWLQNGVANSNATYKYIVGHHPLWTYGYHMFGNHTRLINVIMELHRKHSLTAYLCGHDHNLQHIRKEGLDQFLSGAGATTYPVHNGPNLLFKATGPGFLHVKNQKATFVDQYNKEMYTTNI